VPSSIAKKPPPPGVAKRPPPPAPSSLSSEREITVLAPLTARSGDTVTQGYVSSIACARLASGLRFTLNQLGYTQNVDYQIIPGCKVGQGAHGTGSSSGEGPHSLR
jgi:hypothetical protein